MGDVLAREGMEAERILDRGPLDFGAKSAGILFLKTWAKMPGTSITF